MKRMRIPATTANMGPGFDCIGMAFDMYNYIDFEPVDAEDYCELTSGGDAGHIDLSKDNLTLSQCQEKIEELKEHVIKTFEFNDKVLFMRYYMKNNAQNVTNLCEEAGMNQSKLSFIISNYPNHFPVVFNHFMPRKADCFQFFNFILCFDCCITLKY